MPHVIEYDNRRARIEISQLNGQVLVASGLLPYPPRGQLAKDLWQLTPKEARLLAASLIEVAEYADESMTAPTANPDASSA